MASGWPTQQPLGASQQQQRQWQPPYQTAGPSLPAGPIAMSTCAAQLGPPPWPPGGDGRLRAVEELPTCFRPAFPFRYFNAIQNDCWPTIYESSMNVVISAPTGGGVARRRGCSAVEQAASQRPGQPSSFCPVPLPAAGKTILLELAILRMLLQHISPAGQFGHRPGHLKAVYLAPARALVQASGPGSRCPASAAPPGCLEQPCFLSVQVNVLPLPAGGCRRRCGAGASALRRSASHARS